MKRLTFGDYALLAISAAGIIYGCATIRDAWQETLPQEVRVVCSSEQKPAPDYGVRVTGCEVIGGPNARTR